MQFKNITGMHKIKNVVHHHLKFDGYPSVWDFPNTINLVKSILDKPMSLNLIYTALLESGLLYYYWTCNFLTILGCLEEIKTEELKSTKQIFQNIFASTPENIKNKPSPEIYIQWLIALRNQIKKLDDNQLVKKAGKMAGFIIKEHPAFSIFGKFLEN